MAVTLATLSFTCAALIAVYLPVKRVRTSVPHLAIILWLSGYNLIHGVNAVLWAGNINIHIPVWCDIMTKLMLGANIAIPGAFTCIAIELERLSSSRPVSTNPIVKRNRTILEYVFCYIIPVIYMASHLITQDHRFDIVRDLGCSASTHPSTLGFVIPWLPPVLMCILVFVFSGIASHHANLDRIDSLTAHLKSRSSSMDSSLFSRRLATGMIITGTMSIVNFAALFSVPNYKPWTSWASVHAGMSQINIVQQPTVVDPTKPHGELSSIQIAWWGVFIVSVIYILLSFFIGEEARDAGKWVRGFIAQRKTLPRQLVLPLYNKDSQKEPSSPLPEKSTSRPSSMLMAKPQLRPLTIELKSGWDDYLDEKPAKRKGLLGSAKSLSPISCPSPTTSSRSRSVTPTSSYMSPTIEEDHVFMQSTLSYLSSPTAKTLGIGSLVQMPSPVFSPPSSRTFELPPKPSSPPCPPKPRSIMRASQPKGVPQDVEPIISSVFDVSWPLPPGSPPPSLPPSRHGSPTRSRGHSPDSSAEEMQIGYALYPTVTPPHRRSGRPFEGSSISSLVDVPISPSPAPATSWNSVVRPAIRTLHKSWSKERLGVPHVAPSEVIHMTVVQEIV